MRQFNLGKYEGLVSAWLVSVLFGLGWPVTLVQDVAKIASPFVIVNIGSVVMLLLLIGVGAAIPILFLRGIKSEVKWNQRLCIVSFVFYIWVLWFPLLLMLVHTGER